MSFASGGVTFQRFRVDGPKPQLFDVFHLGQLHEHAAGRQRLASADGVETGWTAGDHILDTAFTEEKNAYPDHLLFDLRVDTDKPPADLLKAYYAVELKALSAHNPSGFPSARQKREAKEIARERLEKEAADGRFRKRKCLPVCWDAATNTVFFGSTSSAHAARLESLFEQTFGVALTPVTAGTLAASINHNSQDATLSTFVRGTTPEEAYWATTGDVSFLGSEFLLWLWFKSATETDTLTLADDSSLTFMFSGGVKLDCPRDATGNDTCNHEGPARMPEALRALRTGKLPRKAGLTIVRHDEQFGLHLQAETLAVSACKLPKPAADVTGRLQSLRDLAEALDLAYSLFLAARLSAAWVMELGDMQRWLAEAGMVRS